MALPVVDEAENRTRLANVAQFGAAGANMPTQAAPVDPRQGAIDAALARGSQIGAPMAVQDQIGGRIGGVYDAGAQGLGAIRSANGGAVGGINAAASEYERQVALAAPIEEGRNKVAIQKILEEGRFAKEDRAFDREQFAFGKEKFDFEKKQWADEHPDDPSAGAIDLEQVGKRLNYSPSQVNGILSNPWYSAAKEDIGIALENKYDYNEFAGLVDSWTKPADADGRPKDSPVIDASTAAFLKEAYGDQFRTPAQKSAKSKGGVTGSGQIALQQQMGSHTGMTPKYTEASLATNRPIDSTSKAQVKMAIDKLTDQQRFVLNRTAAMTGMSPEELLWNHPELLYGK